MKTLLFILLLPVFISAQRDTIFKLNGKIQLCTITLTNESAIFYKDKSGYGDQILNSKVKYYSINGKRETPQDFFAIDFKTLDIDTSRNELGHLKLSRIIHYSDTSLNKNALFDRAKAFIYKTYKSGKNVILYDDKINGELHCEAYTKPLEYNGEIIKNCNGGQFKYKMTIYVKDHKLKVVIDDLIHQKGTCPVESETGSDFGDIYPSTWSKTNYKINRIQYAEFKKQTYEELKYVISTLEKITSAKNNDGDF